MEYVREIQQKSETDHVTGVTLTGKEGCEWRVAGERRTISLLFLYSNGILT